MKENTETLVSNCCGAYPKLYDDNSDTVDHGICSKCRDHCTYVTESKYDDQQAVTILSPSYKKD